MQIRNSIIKPSYSRGSLWTLSSSSDAYYSALSLYFPISKYLLPRSQTKQNVFQILK